MLIQQKIGNININPTNKTIDWLALEWYEANKRIQHKCTQAGREITLKFLNENPNLTQGDILLEEEKVIIAVDILSCNCLVIKPKNMFEMASVSYEIGNKHLPLFYENDELLVAYEVPLFRLLQSMGFMVKQEERKLLQPLKTTVLAHEHPSGGSLFTRIMNLTTSTE